MKQLLLSPFQRFARSEAAGGIVLLICTAIALGLANSPLSESYAATLHHPLSIGGSSLALQLSVHEWINDGLMALFFFLVGLEIKREMLVGELASVRRAATLPDGVSWRTLQGVSWLGGIGSTMSLFVAALAFDDVALLDSAKTGILIASAVAGAMGWFMLRSAERSS